MSDIKDRKHKASITLTLGAGEIVMHPSRFVPVEQSANNVKPVDKGHRIESGNVAVETRDDGRVYIIRKQCHEDPHITNMTTSFGADELDDLMVCLDGILGLR